MARSLSLWLKPERAGYLPGANLGRAIIQNFIMTNSGLHEQKSGYSFTAEIFDPGTTFYES
jgi:hypothetical protein